MATVYAISVIDNDGNDGYLCSGLSDTPTPFRSRKEANETRDFMLLGMADEYQSVNIVKYPKAIA